MLLEEAFAPGVSPDEFFMQMVPRLHQDRITQFRQFCGAAIIFSVVFTDTKTRYSCELGQAKAKVIKGELVDFPAVTIEGLQKNWDAVKSHLLALLEEADRQADAYSGKFRLTSRIVEEFSRFDGVIDVTITDAGNPATLALRFVLNDYAAVDDAPRFGIELPLSVIEDVVRAKRAPGEAAGGLKLSGDKGFAVKLGGFLLKQLDQL
ncbi:MAG: hypothetical protein H0U74_14395 [Bradymonadaceae bacterium]|nr:hypothetical protein [Lujinxingiaceae bacterium]